MSDSHTPENGLAHRNLMRQAIEDVAWAIRAGDLVADDIAQRLDDIASADIADLDSIEIDIDFDGEDTSSHLVEISRPKPVDLDADPVEKALSRTMRLRDRVNGLVIVGDTPGQEDRKAYSNSLTDLRDALVAAHPLDRHTE